MIYPFVLALALVTAPVGNERKPDVVLKQFRCAGKVQYRPCDPEDLRRAELAVRESPKASPKTMISYSQPNRNFAEVLRADLKMISASEGIWQGRIKGNGQVELTLHIFRHGIAEARRFMGSIKLNNKATSFKFRSVVPKGPGWSWRITAAALDS